MPQSSRRNYGEMAMKRFLNCSELIHGFIADWCVPGYGHNINWHWAIGKDAWSISEREGIVTFCYNQNIRKDIYIHSPILTNWGWVTHIPISELTIIGSDNGLSPGRRQTITWTNINWNLRKNFIDILSKIHIFSFKNCIWKCLAQWWPFYRSLNGLNTSVLTIFDSIRLSKAYS